MKTSPGVQSASATAKSFVGPLAAALVSGGPIPETPGSMNMPMASGEPPVVATPADVVSPSVAPQTVRPANATPDPVPWQQAQAQPAAPAQPVPVAQPVQATPMVKAPEVADMMNRYRGEVNPPAAPMAIPDLPPESQIPETLETSASDPEGQSKAAHAFAQLRTENKDLRGIATSAKTALAEKEAAIAALAAEKAEYETKVKELTEQNKEVSERIGQISLAESPEFKTKFDGRVAALENKLAKSLAPYVPLEGEQLLQESRKMLKMNSTELTAYLEETNPMVGATVQLIRNEVVEIEASRDQALKDWRSTAAALDLNTIRQSAVEVAEQRKTYAADGITRAKAMGNPIYNATDPEARVVVEGLTKAFSGFVASCTDAELTAAAAEGFTVPWLVNALEERDLQIATLSNQLESRRRAGLPPMSAAPAYVPPAQPAPAPMGVTRADGLETAAGMRDQLSRNTAMALQQYLRTS